MSATLQYRGKLLHECTLPRETRADGLFPGHINAAQASRDRFLVLYSTRNWRGSDDNCSVICQIRAGAYDGPVLRERCLAESINDWRPFGDGRTFVKAHVHPVVFGVPAGAVVEGRVPANAGLFVFMWNRRARELDPETGFMLHYHKEVPLLDDLSVTEWTQLRLNAAGDDFEVVQPVETLRQRDFGQGYPFCEIDARRMALTMNPPVPLDPSGREWVGSTTYQRPGEPERVGTKGFVYNADRGIYEWRHCGRLSAPGLFESAVARVGGCFVVMARIQKSMKAKGGGPVAWMTLDDPYGPLPDPVCPEAPCANAPTTAFRCADGGLRLFTSDPQLSPYGHPRNPLFMWDIDPSDGFRATGRRTLFDSVAHALPIREESLPVVDQAKVFPHAGGRRQIVAHRVRPRSLASGLKTGVVVNEAEKEVSGIYYSEIEYPEDLPAQWTFAGR
ncbi:MAG: hypothetical protein JJU00_13540 [Opitutales bacterium]|nr:hypothetical protein [Opitutales bacterium]